MCTPSRKCQKSKQLGLGCPRGGLQGAVVVVVAAAADPAAVEGGGGATKAPLLYGTLTSYKLRGVRSSK